MRYRRRLVDEGRITGASLEFVPLEVRYQEMARRAQEHLCRHISVRWSKFNVPNHLDISHPLELFLNRGEHFLVRLLQGHATQGGPRSGHMTSST